MTLSADQIDTDLLPPMLKRIAEVVGLDSALIISERYPGVTMYVPYEARPDHSLAKKFGLATMQALCAEFGGDKIMVPKLDAVKRVLKHELAKEMRRSGLPAREVATQLDYSERHTFRVTSGYLDDKDQLDLFGE